MHAFLELDGWGPHSFRMLVCIPPSPHSMSSYCAPKMHKQMSFGHWGLSISTRGELLYIMGSNIMFIVAVCCCCCCLHLCGVGCLCCLVWLRTCAWWLCSCGWWLHHPYCCRFGITVADSCFGKPTAPPYPSRKPAQAAATADEASANCPASRLQALWEASRIAKQAIPHENPEATSSEWDYEILSFPMRTQIRGRSRGL